MKELDIWLAKNLMGWVDHCNMYWKDPVDGFKRMRKQTTWQPTIDIKQAFECVEKFCTESSFTLHFDPQASYNYDEIHRWISCTPEDENCATATTPALAICLAIKKAEEKK